MELYEFMKYFLTDFCLYQNQLEEHNNDKGKDRWIVMKESANIEKTQSLQSVKINSCPQQLVCLQTDFNGAKYGFFKQSVRMSDFLIVAISENRLYYLVCELKGKNTDKAKKQIEIGYFLAKMLHSVLETMLNSNFENTKIQEVSLQEVKDIRDRLLRELEHQSENNNLSVPAFFLGMIFTGEPQTMKNNLSLSAKNKVKDQVKAYEPQFKESEYEYHLCTYSSFNKNQLEISFSEIITSYKKAVPYHN